MPENGVVFSANPIPPHEYLMRRSYNPNDANAPGAVVQFWQCPECLWVAWDPRVKPASPHVIAPPYCTNHEHRSGGLDGFPQGPLMKIYAVDVPMVKEAGSRWS